MRLSAAGYGYFLVWRIAVGAVVGGSFLAGSARAQQSSAVVRQGVAPQVLERDLSAVTAEAGVPLWREGQPVRVIEDLKEAAGASVAVAAGILVASAVPAATVMPTAGVSFDGIPATGALPPDTVGDVGPRHYVQAVNTALSIYDKAGTLLAGPLAINTLWTGFGGACETLNNGDPIVRYDHLADRWLISQFALPGGAQGFHQCIAISRTGDPVAGGWFLYDFPTTDTVTNQPVFPDYPKIAVWPDAYYMGTQRGFPSSGLDVWAFQRDQMLVGGPAAAVQFAVPAPSLFLMPSDLDGPPPPAGTPNFFVRQVDGERFGGTDRLELYEFHVDWANPAASTFTLVSNLNTQPFDSVLCSSDLMGACIPQPGTPQRLETLTVWPMWRLAYRNLGSYEAMVINHTVDANGKDLAGVRWYELRRSPSGAWSIFQQGTHSPDELNRWMGSTAMDRSGNIAVGYSVSGRDVSPGIRAATRLVTDPPGQLPQPELTLVTGAGSQTHTSRRWGNYSTLDLDPTDDCTFWYTTEYYSATSAAGWRTRIASFRLPSCGAPPPPERFAFEYAAKIVCGLQRNPEDMVLAKGFYATAVNIHNPGPDRTSFRKKLALTHPPEDQTPGKVFEIAKHVLEDDQALETDCVDIQRRLFPNGLPAPYIKGFVVIQSTSSLDVTAVYTALEVDREGRPGNHNSIDVEQIRERRKGAADGCADLVVRSMSGPQVSCPGGGGTCTTTASITIANDGNADAGPFTLRADFDPNKTVLQGVSGLAAGSTQTLTLTTTPGGNCFDPDCTIKATVDSADVIKECNESNNQLSQTTPG